MYPRARVGTIAHPPRDSLWVFQRLLYALKPKGDYPPLPGQPWPKSFERVMERRPLWGSLDEIRDDIKRYADAGLTELFLEPNFQPGGASLDPVLAHMEALAPRA